MFYNDGKHLILQTEYLKEPFKTLCRSVEAKCQTHADNWNNYSTHVVFCIQWTCKEPKDEQKIKKGLKDQFKTAYMAGMVSDEEFKYLWFETTKEEIKEYST